MVIIDQYVSDFIKDAQFRIAEIGVRLEDLKDKQEPEYLELEGFRLELYQFMDILYVGEWSIRDDGYNHLDWTDYEIRQEAEYLRNATGMITSPYTTFVSYFPSIGQIPGAEEAGGLPAGDPDSFILYDVNGNPVTVDFPTAVGAIASDTVENYFS